MNFNTIEKFNTAMSECGECSVRHSSLFKNVSDCQLDKTADIRNGQLKIPARTRIFQDGGFHENIYTVYSGWAVIYKTAKNSGKRQILRFLLPGDLLGNQIDDRGLMSYSAGSVTECVLCAYPRAKVKTMLKEHPKLALRMIDMLSRDLSMSQNHLLASGRKTARESVVYILMELFYRVQYQMPDNYNKHSNTIDLPVTQEDIGDAIGLTNVHVNRVIKELMKEKLIICSKKHLTILNEQELCEIAEFKPEMAIILD